MEKAIGIVLDLSLRHEKDGRRLIDNVKKSLVTVICECLEDGQDLFYLYHPAILDFTDSRGEQVCAVGNYETDGWIFNLEYALKQTLYILATQHCRKQLFCISDRLKDANAFNKIMAINKKDRIDAEIVFINIGNNHFIHIDEASQLTQILKEKINGENSCCSTND